jgi:hypothetical protein
MRGAREHDLHDRDGHEQQRWQRHEARCQRSNPLRGHLR